ncbi:GNAT family N-acetyltransferase [Chitinophaga nivalis]|uniref:GNAT family N-acetyltransferase n=1 Tax=Chitinophaga nivalis TaxID=2991709 RepID=A0ABT3INQ0_9BACT|nr:GNAT family N-acetyltransferase [Chitinophaga nivalis]MCW3464783.1 GNAT family N-acetyltransferase [Chitinophaga nivalis]MCW3485526.1 GNAT family N-acetyltransferase [Chitinophaga nivalis]
MHTTITYLPAAAGDAEILTDIAFQSKRHWNYPEAWIQLWTESLTITPAYIQQNQVIKIIYADQVVGFYSLEYNGEQLFIDHFWILPSFIGHGLGKEAFADLRHRCIARNETIIKVESDPNADGFYTRMGATKTGIVNTLIEGRTLNIFQFHF